MSSLPYETSFFGEAESYDLSRPNYDYILPFVMEAIEPAVTNSSSNPSVDILELGSGTGIFGESLSRYVLSCSSSETATPISAFSLRPRRLVSAEPAPELYAKMRSKYAELQPSMSQRLTMETLEARSESVPLPVSCARAVLCANSLHWFSNEESMREIHRLLMPNGILAAVWSTQDFSRPPWSLFYQKWIEPLYTQLGMPAIDTDLNRKALIERFEHVFPRSGPVHHRELITPSFIVPVEKQLAWVCSSSPYNRAPTDAERRAMLDEMRAEIIRSEHYNVATDSTPFTLVYSIVWAQCRKEYS